MPDNPRIEELRRRVQKDPASIAFAQLAEEHRRAGDFEEAIQVSRAGLDQHPGYLSARVTLGRALVETGQYEEARIELEQVLRAAPDNLAAIRALADIHQRLEGGTRHDSGGGDGTGVEVATARPFDPADAQFVRALDTLDAAPRIPAPVEPPPLDLPAPDFSPVESAPGEDDRSFPPAPAVHSSETSSIETLSLDLASLDAPTGDGPSTEESPAPDLVLAELEAWLDTIQADREMRRAGDRD